MLRDLILKREKLWNYVKLSYRGGFKQVLSNSLTLSPGSESDFVKSVKVVVYLHHVARKTQQHSIIAKHSLVQILHNQ